MALQFQQPFQIQQQPTPLQAFSQPVGQAINTLPELWDQYKQRRIEQKLKLMELNSKYGTGAPPPQQNTPYSPPAFDPSGGTGDLSQIGQPPTGAGIGPGIPGTPIPESPEQQIGRMGTEVYGRLHPAAMMAGMMQVPMINKEGQQIGTTQANSKVVDAKDTYVYDPLKGTTTKVGPTGADVKIAPNMAAAQNIPFKNEEDLRKEFVKESADQKANLSAANDALSAAKQNNAVGDTKLTYALVRGALGGSGRVTGAELGQWGDKVGGVSDKVMQGLQKAINGQSFDPEIRSQIVDMVRQQAQEESGKLSATENTYRGLATDKGLQPGHVIVEQRPPSLLPYLNPNTPGTGKQLDAQTAMNFLKQANGDKNKARQMAKDQGYSL